MIFHDCIAKNKANACQIARLHSFMWWFNAKVSIEPDFIVNDPIPFFIQDTCTMLTDKLTVATM